MLPYSQAGTGPVVVLLHAGVADRTMWDGLLGSLAESGFRAIAFDLPGFGETPVRSGPQAPWDDVLQSMAALSIDRAALIGNSWGGAVALRIAVRAPAALWALGVVSAPAPGIDPSPELLAAWSAEEEALDRGDLDDAVAAVVDAWTLPGATPELRDRIAAMQRRAFELQRQAPPSSAGPDPLAGAEQLASIDLPTLVMAGSLDKSDFVDGAAFLTGAIPGAQHEVLVGAGHLAPLEQPDAFRALLLPFLQEHAPANFAAAG